MNAFGLRRGLAQKVYFQVVNDFDGDKKNKSGLSFTKAEVIIYKDK
jgi:hypothetical protein